MGDLVTAPTEGQQVLPAIVGRVVVDVMPVEPLDLAASLTLVGLGEQPDGLTPTTGRGVRLSDGSRSVRYAPLRPTDGIADRRRARRPEDRIAFAFRPARQAERRVSGDRRTAVRARLGAQTRLTSGLHPARSVRPLGVVRQGLDLATCATSLHARSLQECHRNHYNRLATWRCSDPGQLAAALQVDKPAPVASDQLDLFEGLGA